MRALQLIVVAGACLMQSPAYAYRRWHRAPSWGMAFDGLYSTCAVDIESSPLGCAPDDVTCQSNLQDNCVVYSNAVYVGEGHPLDHARWNKTADIASAAGLFTADNTNHAPPLGPNTFDPVCSADMSEAQCTDMGAELAKICYPPVQVYTDVAAVDVLNECFYEACCYLGRASRGGRSYLIDDPIVSSAADTDVLTTLFDWAGTATNGSDIEDWEEVTTDSTGHVVYLYIFPESLGKNMPAAVGSLTAVKALQFINYVDLDPGNNGEYPPEIGLLDFLNVLELDDFVGAIPCQYQDLADTLVGLKFDNVAYDGASAVTEFLKSLDCPTPSPTPSPAFPIPSPTASPAATPTYPFTFSYPGAEFIASMDVPANDVVYPMDPSEAEILFGSICNVISSGQTACNTEEYTSSGGFSDCTELPQDSIYLRSVDGVQYLQQRTIQDQSYDLFKEEVCPKGGKAQKHVLLFSANCGAKVLDFFYDGTIDCVGFDL